MSSSLRIVLGFAAPDAKRAVQSLFVALALMTLQHGAAMASPATMDLTVNWMLASARDAGTAGGAISREGYDTKGWHPVRQVPATVLEILQEDGIYPNLYYGENFARA